MSELDQHRLNSELKWLYDRYRTAHYNALYYGEGLVSERKKNRRFEIAVAFTTPGAIGGLAIFGTAEHGVIILLGIVASVLAAIKPILNISDSIQRHTRLFTSYKEVAAELKLLVERVRSEQDFTEKTRFRFADLAKKWAIWMLWTTPRWMKIEKKDATLRSIVNIRQTIFGIHLKKS